jgi:glyoxylase-like metal-dependent hydrolase (beta-lactamase superfamily II)
MAVNLIIYLKMANFQHWRINAQVLLVAGHTPADVAYVIEDAVFVG